MSELKRPEADVLANVQVVTVDLPPVSGEEPHFAQTPEDTGINAPVVAMVRVPQPDGDYLRMQVHDLRDFRSDPAQPDGVHRVPVETGGQQGARARAIRPIRADFLVINPDLWNGP